MYLLLLHYHHLYHHLVLSLLYNLLFLLYHIDNYYKSSKQEDPEPEFICRHRLLHGIITREVTASDCLKLFLTIRSFAYLERLFIAAEKLIKYNSLTLQTEDRLLFGDEEYKKILQDLKK